METAKKWHIASLVIIIFLTIALIACLFWVRSLSDRLVTLEVENYPSRSASQSLTLTLTLALALALHQA